MTTPKAARLLTALSLLLAAGCSDDASSGLSNSADGVADAADPDASDGDVDDGDGDAAGSLDAVDDVVVPPDCPEVVEVSVDGLDNDCDGEIDESSAVDVAGIAELLETVGSGGLCDGQHHPADVAALAAAHAAVVASAAETDSVATEIESAIAALSEQAAALEASVISHTADLGALYEGVTAVAPPGGSPSTIAPHNCNGLMVFNQGLFERGTIAAGRYGQGRMLVFTKEISAYLPALEDASANADTTQLARNLMAWLTARNPAGYAATQAAGVEMPVLVATGYSAFDPTLGLAFVEVDDLLGQAALFDPAVNPVAIVNPRIADPAVAAMLMDYMDAGGSLLMGHQIWTWNVEVRASASQWLLSRAGLLWGSWYGDGGGAVPPIDQLVRSNVMSALDWIEEVEAAWPDTAPLGYVDGDGDRVVGFATAVLGWLHPDDDPYIAALRVRYDAVEITYPAELSARPYARAIVPVYHLTARLRPGQTAGKGVEVFPGLVDAAAPRESLTLPVAMDREDAGWVRTSVPPRPRLSTAMYAPPGEDVVITVAPAGGGAPDPQTQPGIDTWFGCHTDKLSDKVELDRAPVIAFRGTLAWGENALNNPYGGLIYLEPTDYRAEVLDVTIDGGVLAPSFELGVDTNATWTGGLRDRPAPFGEVLSGPMVVSLPAWQLRLVDDAEALAQAWADIMANTYDLQGLQAASAPPHAIPVEVNRFVEDAQISAGWMHSGYPIMSFVVADLHLLENSLSWGPYHEIGHNYQQGDWMLPGSGEVTTNLFSLYQQQQFGQGDRLVDQDEYGSTATAVASGATYDDLSVWQRLVFYRQLSLAYGWDFYRELYTRTRQAWWDQGYARADGETQADYLLRVASDVGQQDLTSFLDHYGVVTSQGARDAVAAMGLPEPNPPLWTLP